MARFNTDPADILSAIQWAVAGETNIPVNQLDGDAAFEGYGIESVLAVAIVRRLEDIFGELPKTLLFEYQSINALLTYFLTEHDGDAVGELSESPSIGGAAEAAAAPARNIGASPPAAESAPAAAREGPLAAPGPPGAPEVDDIAIIGISGRFPLARDLDEFWDNLREGRDCITEIPERLWDWRDYWHPDPNVPGKSYSKWGGFIEDSDCFDPLFFNISNLQAASMDPQERLFLETVHHTLEDAGYTKNGLSGRRVGLYVAAMWGAYQHYGLVDGSTDSSFSSIANRASYFFGFTGPSLALDTTCSGSLTTLHLACESLRSGDSDLAVAGGVNITSHPQKYVVLSRTGFASPDGRCKSFGDEARGYVPGDGCGALLLKPLRAAIADNDRIHGVIKATAVNHGGRSSGFTVPSAEAQAELIEMALRKAGVDARSLSYIEAHAPGTALGDPIEVRGLTSAFRKYGRETGFCPIGSVKSNVGHLESAAGFASVAKVLVQLKHKQIAPSLHCERTNPNIDFESTPFYVNCKLAQWDRPRREIDGRTVSFPRRAGISAFGSGGANAHVIIEEYETPAAAQSPAPEAEQLILLSAKTEERLREVVARMREALSRWLVSHQAAAGGEIEPLRDRVLGSISRAAKIRPALLDEGDSLADLLPGADARAELLSALGHEGGHLPADQVAGLTIEGLIEALETGAPGRALADEAASAAFLEQVAYTLQVGRDAMECRFATVVGSTSQLLERLTAFLDGTETEETWTDTLAGGRATPVSGAEEQDYIHRLLAGRRLASLGRMWTGGVPVPWERLYRAKPRRIGLPLYPFARERCWVERPAAMGEPRPSLGAPAAAGQDGPSPARDTGLEDLQRLCYRPQWRALDRVMPAAEASPRLGSAGPPGASVLIYPEAAAGAADALRQLLPGDVYEILLGSRNELLSRQKWEIDAADGEALGACLGFARNIAEIYFLGGASLTPYDPRTKAGFDGIQTVSLLALFHVMQWLCAQDGDARKAIRMKVVTNQNCAVEPGERVQPYTAGVLGLARAFMREHPEVECELADLRIVADGASIDAPKADLKRVIEGVAGHPEYAIRAGRVLVRELRPYDLPEAANGQFRQDGAYVLIGGAGVLGGQLSRHLATTRAARLVWLGRRPADEAIAAQQAEIEALGGSLTYLPIDASEPDRLGEALDEVERRHGRIDGIFNLARAHHIARIDAMDEADLRRVVGAKIDTTYALRQAVGGRDVGFVLLFSSAEAYVGGAGWSAYAAGCAFQDAFALDWSQRAACPVLGINWGYWQGVDEDVHRMLQAKGIHPLPFELGFAVLEAVLAGGVAQLAALDVEANVLERMGFTPRAAAEAAVPAGTSAAAVMAPPQPQARPPMPGERRRFDPSAFDPASFEPAAYDPETFPRGDNLPGQAVLGEAVADLISDVLKIDRSRLDFGADLITYGIDSLSVIALHKTLEARTGTLPATLFITSNTIDAVAAELIERFPVAAWALAGQSAAGPAPPPPAVEAPPPLVLAANAPSRALGRAAPTDILAYLDGYGSRFHDGTLDRLAAEAMPCIEPLAEASWHGLDHRLVDTPSAAGVEVLSAGDGLPVILLSAVGLTAPTWRYQLASPLARHMRLIVPHVPGYGLTKPIAECTSAGVTQVVRDIIDLVSPDRPVHVVASCLGCVTGMNLALRCPERLASLTLVGGFLDTSDMAVGDPAKLTADELTNLLEGAVDRIRDDFAAVTATAGASPGDLGVQQQLDLLLHGLCANAIVALRYLTEMLTLPVLDWLPGIGVPTQCLYGTKDLIVNPRHSDTIAAAVSGAGKIAIEGAGHFPYLTHSEVFNPLIDEFIRRCETQAGQDPPPPRILIPAQS